MITTGPSEGAAAVPSLPPSASTSAPVESSAIRTVRIFKAEAAKAKGNACFKEKLFDDAIGHYSEAISLNDSNHEFFSHRSDGT